jgi:LmbE family N-acetylglucosaminyl deacetylase
LTNYNETFRLPLYFNIKLSNNFSRKQPRHPARQTWSRTLKKFNVLGSVLYVAAHPDDENTRLAWLTWPRSAITAPATCRLTRGDGGQNLIGTEQAELLGAIRTQELLAARRVDGAEQFFSRANDFGFSKGPDETLEDLGPRKSIERCGLGDPQF